MDDSFGGGEGEGGSSFVSLEDVISFVAETKTLMNPSETPSLDTLPIPDADWGLEQVVDGISLQNILQVSFHMKGLGIQATALVSNGYIKTRLLISSKTLLFSSLLSSPVFPRCLSIEERLPASSSTCPFHGAEAKPFHEIHADGQTDEVELRILEHR